MAVIRGLQIHMSNAAVTSVPSAKTGRRFGRRRQFVVCFGVGAVAVTNGDACLRWLANDRPNLDEARQAAERIVRNGHRSSDIIRSLRALAGKPEPEMTQLDINDAIREVLAYRAAPT